MTDAAAPAAAVVAPVHLATPLELSPDARRTLFTQQALDTHLADVERPTEILEPATAGIDKDNTAASPLDSAQQEQQAQTTGKEMGILNVLTGNISPPADMGSAASRDATNGHGVISNDIQANTHGPSSRHNFIRTDHVEEHLQPTEPIRSATPLTAEEKEPHPLPISAVSEERHPIPGATGDGYSPNAAAVLHTTGDRPASAAGSAGAVEPVGAREEHAPLAVHDGIEEGVSAQPAADGTYEAVRGETPVSRPPLGEEPSRSYIKRPESALGRADSTRASTINERPASRARDYATGAAPVALAPPEPISEGVSHNEHIPPAAAGIVDRQPSFRESVKAPTENGYAAHNEEDVNKDRGETPVRALMAEGQAYRSDGSVPGQPQQQQQQQHGQQYGQYAVPLAGAGVAGAAAYGLHQHQAHQNDPSFAQERAMSPGPNNFVGGNNVMHDPATQMSRLSFQDPAQVHMQQQLQQQQQQQQQQYQNGGLNGGVIAPAAGVGPSPGPPVSALSPTSPIRRTPEQGTDLGRNSTMRSTGGLSRGSTLRKGGAFANGSALQGGGVGEAFGRDDIHERTAGADRGLMGAGPAGQAGMHRISKEEARDSKRLSKMIKSEGKIEAAAVRSAIKELESLQKVQRAAHGEELKAQQKHAKFTRVEHKARLRFLKEKERYERVEAQLRSIEADYEAKREHAAQQTDLLAEKTQELNDLRAQKAADDRERELKLLALKNPGHT